MKYIFLLLFVTSCTSTTKTTETLFFLELDDCLKTVFNQTKKFSKTNSKEKILSYIEQGNKVIDLVDLLNQTKKSNMPVILYFNSYACANCRRIEEQVLNNTEISERLKREYIFISLTVDDRTKLQEGQAVLLSNECYSYGTNRKLDRIGKINSFLQSAFSETGSQPYFYAFDSNTELGGSGFVKTPNEFDEFLNAINNKRN